MTNNTLRPVIVLPGAPRLHLHRETHNSVESTSDPTLSPVGVDLGDGLILDTLGNIGLIVPEAMGQDWSTVDSFSEARIKEESPLGSEFNLKQHGNTMDVDNADFGAEDFHIKSHGENVTSIEPQNWGSAPIIVTRHEDDIYIDNTAFGATDHRIRRKDGKIFIESKGYGSTRVAIQASPERLRVHNGDPIGGNFEAVSRGSVIYGRSSSWAGQHFTITQNEGGATVDNRDLETDYEISRGDKQALSLIHI